MCRLAYITKRFEGCGAWLDQLERSFGGDGNGLVVGRRQFKGVDLKVSDLGTIVERSFKPALFHTRKVSSGTKCDALCHPFKCHGGHLAHNGHWWMGDNAIKLMSKGYNLPGPLSDSKYFARLVTMFGFRSATKEHKPGGVWLWMSQSGKLSIFKNGGDLWYNKALGAFGSEPPNGTWDGWAAVKDGYYEPGDTVDIDAKAMQEAFLPDEDEDDDRDAYLEDVMIGRRRHKARVSHAGGGRLPWGAVDLRKSPPSQGGPQQILSNGQVRPLIDPKTGKKTPFYLDADGKLRKW